MLLFAVGLVAQVDLRPPNLASCTPAVAQPVSVRQLASRPRRYQGRCVTVSGPTYIYRMYESVPGIYLSIKRGRGGRIPARHLSQRLGLYFGSGDAEDGRPALPRELLQAYHPTSVTGVADSCGRMSQALPRGPVETADPETGERSITITMLGGYCHYSGGAVVWVTQSLVDTTRRYERLVGEEARARYGTLVPAPRDWQHYRRLRDLAYRFRRAVATGDRKSLSSFDPFVGGEDLRYVFEDHDSPFRELRDGADKPFEVLVEEDDSTGRSSEMRQDREAELCFCRTDDCSDSWPIASFDARDDLDHPYVCVAVEEDGDEGIILSFGHREEGTQRSPLREPAGTALPNR